MAAYLGSGLVASVKILYQQVAILKSVDLILLGLLGSATKRPNSTIVMANNCKIR